MEPIVAVVAVVVVLVGAGFFALRNRNKNHA